MYTIDELTRIIRDNYTPDELIDILELKTTDICERFDDVIEDLYDELCQKIIDDLGYEYEDD
jgi:hypothetical protein